MKIRSDLSATTRTNNVFCVCVHHTEEAHVLYKRILRMYALNSRENGQRISPGNDQQLVYFLSYEVRWVLLNKENQSEDEVSYSYNVTRTTSTSGKFTPRERPPLFTRMKQWARIESQYDERGKKDGESGEMK